MELVIKVKFSSYHFLILFLSQHVLMISFVSLVSIRICFYHESRLILDCPNPPKQISQQIFAFSVWVYVTNGPVYQGCMSFFMGTGHLRRNPVRLQPVGRGAGGLRYVLCNGSRGDNEHIDKSSHLIYQNPIISDSRLFDSVCPGSGED